MEWLLKRKTVGIPDEYDFVGGRVEHVDDLSQATSTLLVFLLYAGS